MKLFITNNIINKHKLITLLSLIIISLTLLTTIQSNTNTNTNSSLNNKSLLKTNLKNKFKTVKATDLSKQILTVDDMDNNRPEIEEIDLDKFPLYNKVTKAVAFTKRYYDKDMNIGSFKNVILTDHELVVYKSKNPETEDLDNPIPTTKNYVYTVPYNSLQLACLERKQVCTYNQFVKEYKKDYSEINMDLPTEIKDVMDNKTGDQCLLLTSGAFLKLQDVFFLCTKDKAKLILLQQHISNAIEKAYEGDMVLNVEYFQDYNNPSSLIKGSLHLDEDNMRFFDIENKEKALTDDFYLDIKDFTYPFHDREKFPAEHETSKISIKIPDFKDKNFPFETRCFKVLLNEKASNSDVENPPFRVYCINYDNSDKVRDNVLSNTKSRWLNDFYTALINEKIQNAKDKDALDKLNKSTEGEDINIDLLSSLAKSYRSKMIKSSNKKVAISKINNNYNKSKLSKELEQSKSKVRKEVCQGNELCTKGLELLERKGAIPLGKKREKLALDPTNPYSSLMPKENIKIDNLKNSRGKKLVSELSKYKGTSDYWAEKQFRSSNSLSRFDIYNAFKEMIKIRRIKRGQAITEDLFSGSITKRKLSGYSFSRSISLLSDLNSDDIFFDYLGHVRNKVFKIKEKDVINREEKDNKEINEQIEKENEANNSDKTNNTSNSRTSSSSRTVTKTSNSSTSTTNSSSQHSSKSLWK